MEINEEKGSEREGGLKWKPEKGDVRLKLTRGGSGGTEGNMGERKGSEGEEKWRGVYLFI